MPVPDPLPSPPPLKPVNPSLLLVVIPTLANDRPRETEPPAVFVFLSDLPRSPLPPPPPPPRSEGEVRQSSCKTERSSGVSPPRLATEEKEREPDPEPEPEPEAEAEAARSSPSEAVGRRELPPPPRYPPRVYDEDDGEDGEDGEAALSRYCQKRRRRRLPSSSSSSSFVEASFRTSLRSDSVRRLRE